MASCASSASTGKIPLENNRSKSCETTCTSNSSCILKKRKQILPYSIKQNSAPKVSTNAVRQRIMSAKLLKLRSIQSQLNDANFHVSELTRENQALKRLQKLQDKALTKFENTKADLPRLIHSHEEEIRSLTEKNKILKKNLKEVSDNLKQKEDELILVKDHLKHLEKLNKNKHLTEREKLTEQVDDLKLKLAKSEGEVSLLNRKLMLECKNSKHRLNGEILKNKQAQKDMVRAMNEIEHLSNLLEAAQIPVKPPLSRGGNKMPNRQTMSLICLDQTEKLNRDKAPVSEIKLEPIKIKQNCDIEKPSSLSKMPSENIKSRLSSGSSRDLGKKSSSTNLSENSSGSSKNESPRNLNKTELTFSKDRSSGSLDKIELAEVKSSETLNGDTNLDGDKKINTEYFQDEKGIREETSGNSSESDDNSSNYSHESLTVRKLDDLSKKLEETKGKSETFDKTLGDYCSEVINGVKTCSNVIKYHKDSIKSYQNDTNQILETFENTKSIENQLKNSFLSNEDGGLDFLEGILFNKKEQNVKQKEAQNKIPAKDRLLAQLRAIDNGDSSFESVEEQPDFKKPTGLMQELFGDI